MNSTLTKKNKNNSEHTLTPKLRRQLRALKFPLLWCRNMSNKLLKKNITRIKWDVSTLAKNSSRYVHTLNYINKNKKVLVNIFKLLKKFLAAYPKVGF